MYTALKYIHVISVVLSVTGFFLRGVLVIRASPVMDARWIKVLPHVNDTILLVAALSLAALSEQYPFVADWVTAKVLGVFAYIILGALALRPEGTAALRIVCGLSALAVFGWIVSVALTRQPMGLLAVLL
ncbi:MAG: SirB2 family protein [Burkholderiaceae bacterium]|nr:SirB2 family protein [Sulfuritalea sp.]MCF8174643.1 SirB2 family protein [Burkholderiaceae bacterium]MCF8184201.1 SirB2 family protein [Polynucleobacter sp.]